MEAILTLEGECNNNCFFCSKCQKPKTTTQAQNEITQLKKQGASELSITGSEPALRKDLFKLVSFAKTTGFEKTTLQTNARMLSYQDYAQKLKKNGLTHINTTLFSHDEKTHQAITQTKNSWQQTVEGIKNAQKNNIKAKVTVPILPQNFALLAQTIQFLIGLKVKQAVLNHAFACSNQINLLPYSRSMPFVHKCFDFENLIDVSIEGIAPCTLGSAIDHFAWKFKEMDGFEKIDCCKNCKFLLSCSGIPVEYLKKFSKKEFRPVKDKFEHLKIEVTPGCNADCYFCYNKNTFAKNSRPKGQLSTIQVKRALEKAAKAGVSFVQFTGGEPLLREDLFELTQYAKDLGIYASVNTNTLLLNAEKAGKIQRHADEIAVSLHSVKAIDSNKHYSKAHLLKKKSLLKTLREGGVAVGANTIADAENIENLDEFHKTVGEIGFDFWHILRPFPPFGKQITNKDFGMLIEKLIRFREGGSRTTTIKYSFPFCAYDPFKVAEVSSSYVCNLNSTSLVLSPSGVVRSSIEFDFALGNVFEDSFEECWNNKYVKGIQNLEFLPKTCIKCRFVGVCRGGSRHATNTISKGLLKLDPLAQPEKYKKILFS